MEEISDLSDQEPLENASSDLEEESQDKDLISRRQFISVGTSDQYRDERGSAQDKLRGMFLGALMVSSGFTGAVAFSGLVAGREKEIDFTDYDDFPLDQVKLEGLENNYRNRKVDVYDSVRFNVPELGEYSLTVEDGNDYFETTLDFGREDHYEVELDF